MSERISGVVKWFNNARGYGFIICADGTEAFVHHKDIGMEGYRFLKRGQQVEFRLISLFTENLANETFIIFAKKCKSSEITL